MKINRKIMLSISVMILVLLSTFIPVYLIYRDKDLRTKHEPIIIWRDADFQNFNFEGNGSKENPYLIENYKIITDFKYGIYIKNTFKFFIIQNCYLEASEYGIYIQNIADGTAIIIDNECVNNKIGIEISNSDGIIVANNTCSENIGSTGGGILVKDSALCNITNNNCNHNNPYGMKLENIESCNILNNSCNSNKNEFQGAGIYVFHSTYTCLENNICRDNRKHGIHISVSDHNLVLNNLCEENEFTGIYLNAISFSSVSQNKCLKNKNWYKSNSQGLALYYSSFCIINENTINSNIGNGIFLDSDTNCIVSNNIISNQTGYPKSLYSKYSTYFGYALYCYSSYNISIFNNLCYNNFGSLWAESLQTANISSNSLFNSVNYTCDFYACDNLIFKNNILNENKEGINFYETNSSLIIFNLIQETETYALSLLHNSRDNIIHHNSFIDNNLGGFSQAFDEGIGNTWYDNVSLHGNYWNDWVSGNYSIDGSANSEDPYCLIENPVDILFSMRVDNLKLFNKITNLYVISFLSNLHYNTMLEFSCFLLVIPLKYRKEQIKTNQECGFT